MAFEKVSTILKMADEAGTSALAFNCIDYNTAYSVVTAAEEVNKPAIVMLYPEHNHLNNAANLSEFTGMVKELAENVRVPIGLHLDHSNDFDFILHAIKCGFTSVMYDGSMLPVEENIANSKKVVEVARVFGVDVEAELGRVGFAANKDQDNLDMYTKPDVAAKFCAETGVTSVAVAIGSAHGVYHEEPKLDLERLKEINSATDAFLVLHGGSGIPNDQLDIAFKDGINKFNVGTEFFQLEYDTIKEFCAQKGEKGNVFDMPKYVQQKLIEYLCVKLQLCKMTV